MFFRNTEILSSMLQAACNTFGDQYFYQYVRFYFRLARNMGLSIQRCTARTVQFSTVSRERTRTPWRIFLSSSSSSLWVSVTSDNRPLEAVITTTFCRWPVHAQAVRSCRLGLDSRQSGIRPGLQHRRPTEESPGRFWISWPVHPAGGHHQHCSPTYLDSF